MANGQQQETVTYKASFTRPDGGWDHMEVTLFVGASNDRIALAFDQWQRMRERGLPTIMVPTKTPATLDRAAPDSVEATPADDPEQHLWRFGKHANRTLGWIWQHDPDYIHWMAEKGRNIEDRDRAQAIIDRYAAQDEASQNQEELPF